MAAHRPWQTNRVPNNADTVQGQQRHDDSWVEISSQPSSSSLSSIGDDVVTSRLRVGVGRKPSTYGNAHNRPPPNEAVGPRSEPSSHDEYEETSDEDLLLTSSTEYLASHNQASLASPRHRDYNSNIDMTDSDDGDGEDDENATALGTSRGATPHSPPGFRPQPNAFSHPPRHPTLQSSSHRSRNATSAGPAPAPHPHSAFSRRSLHGSRPQHTASASPADFMMPSCAAVDSDAALRASLTTLLSCAAGLRKDDTTRSAASRVAPIHPSQQPMELRLVPESELMAAEPARAVTNPPQQQRSRNKTNSEDKSKRSAAMTTVGGVRSSQRTAKKSRIDEPTSAMVSPTLLTWVVSAGLVVLVGFGAGYVIGREVGKQEAMAGMNISSVAGESAAGCGREAIRGSGGTALKRLRWGASFGKSIVT